MQKKVCVVGLGYIGLPTAALLASKGYEVVGVDVNSAVVEIINQGNIHIVEPDLGAIVRSSVRAGQLKAYATPQSADIYMICVPTPFHRGLDGILTPNIDYVVSAVKGISPLIKNGDLLILESTSPVGTTEVLRQVLMSAGVDTDCIFIAYCPERVLPGRIMKELVINDRVVGGLTQHATVAVSNFYKSFVEGCVLETDAKTAEMCKLTENSFRDVNIAFANELSMICEKEGVDVWKLIHLANRHPRVNILQPGPGVGGHCIAVDPWFIVSRDPENARIIRMAREVNDHKCTWVIDRINMAIENYIEKQSRMPKVALMGLTFKPNIDDLRESPALFIAEQLKVKGRNILVVEPNITSHDQFYLATIGEAFESGDIIVLLVGHKEFISEEFKECCANKVVMDFCGLLS